MNPNDKALAVEAIRLKNFMAFEDTGWLELRSISLLFGRNSHGKSAIIRALLLLSQSIRYGSMKEPLVFVVADGFDFGDFKTMVHKQDWQNKRIGFQFRCRLNVEHGEAAEKIYQHRLASKDAEISFSKKYRYRFDLNIEFALEAAERKDDEENKDKVVLRELSIDCPWLMIDGEAEHTVFRAVYLDIEDKKYYGYSENDQNDDDWWLLHSDFLFGEESERKSWIFSTLNIDLASGFLPELQTNENLPSIEDSRDLNFLTGVFLDFHDKITSFLEAISYIGPMRPEPKRVFAIDSAEASRLDKRRELLDFLRFLKGKADRAEVDKLNRWLSEKLEFGNKIIREGTDFEQAIIAKVEVEQSEKVPPINLREVGYGTSQVLPILALGSFIEERKAKFVIIEQPELHLHPSAQADLADLFIDAIYKSYQFETDDKGNLKEDSRGKSIVDSKKRDIQFLLETHSEHFMLRLQRRVSETTYEHYRPNPDKPRNDRFSLENKDLGIFFVCWHKESGSSTIEMINVDHRGQLVNPSERFQDFFKYDYDEVITLNLTTGQIMKLEKGDEPVD